MKKDINHRKIFRRFKAGEQLTDGFITKLTDAVEELTSPTTSPHRQDSRIRFVSLRDVMGKFLNSPGSERSNRRGYKQWWNDGDLELENTSAERFTISDPYKVVYDADETLAIFHDPNSQKHFPLNPRYVRHAITWPVTTDDSESSGSDVAGCGTISSAIYPSRDSRPTVYAIKFVRISFTETAGPRVPSVTYLSNNLCHDALALNLACTEDPPWISPYSLVTVYNCIGANGEPQWFFNQPVECEQVSSSSSSHSVSFSSNSSSKSSLSSQSTSSQSASSKSSSDSSASSQSASSASSQSASSASSLSSLSSLSSASSVSSQSRSNSSSSRGSSNSSSSRGSSASSSSRSSQSASSRSVSDSSGFDCVTVVTSLSFDSSTCILTYGTRQLCFPASLGVTVGDEAI